jgi:GTPase SAR1 family protein
MQENETSRITKPQGSLTERLLSPLNRLVQTWQAQQAPVDALVARANRQALIEDARQRCESLLADALPCKQRFPYGLLLQDGDQSQVLDSDTWLIQFAPAQSERLAIVGPSGSGKSFLLHSLALELLDQVDDDEGAVVPILLSLASWDGHTSFKTWLRESLAQRFCTTSGLIAKLLKNERTVLLIDDFELIALTQGYLNSIQSCLEEYQTALVICCEPEVYQADLAQIAPKALLPQAMPFELVEQIVDSADRPGLHHTLLALPELADLSQNPLMLKLMLGAYRHNHAPTKLATDREGLREQVIEDYIEHSLGKLAKQDELHTTKLKQRLGWLAHNLQKHKHGNEFQIEWLQPSWLQPIIWRWLWSVFILVGISVIGCIITVGWFLAQFASSTNRESLIELAGAILPVGLAIGLGGALPKAVDQIYPRERLDWSTSHMLERFVPTLTAMFQIGCIFGGFVFLNFAIGQNFYKGMFAFFTIMSVLQSLTLGVVLVDGSKASKIAPRFVANQAILGNFKSLLFGIPFAGLIGFIISSILLLSLLLSFVDLKVAMKYIGLENLLRILGILSLPLTMLACFIGFIGFGGAALFQHYLLRLLLCLSGLIPLNLPAWLEETSKTGLIVRFGGYYRFQHPSIQAALAKKRPASQY